MQQCSYGKRSIKTWLVTAFLTVSVVPILAANIISYVNTSSLVRQNTEGMTRANLQQTRVSLDVWLESYEDILYQVYTDDSIVEVVDRINAGKDIANNRKTLRRTLRGLFYTKDYVKSIAVITESGELVFYDQLTASTTDTSWMDSIQLSQKELYEEISRDSRTHLLPTGSRVEFGSNSCYLFHIGHRIIDYRNIGKQCGVVLVSIDESLLREICSSPTESGLNFIVDSNGYVISCPGAAEIGQALFPEDASETEKQAAYRQLARQTGLLKGEELSIYSLHDEKTGWDIICAMDQEELLQALRQQQQLTVAVTAISLLAVLIIIVSTVATMTGSIQRVVETMRKAGQGDLSVHVAPDRRRPREIEIIAQEFNQAMDRLKLSAENQRNAEIAALEAQINPHFLYNTLDAINWMAIDKDEYDISNAIAALANILRYGISNSNGTVKIREEVDWLKQYIFVQQIRLKNTFECRMEIDPEIMELPIHKLLLQPFIENTILHGFKGENRLHQLRVGMCQKEGRLNVEIADNGCGIREDIVEEMNRGVFRQETDKNHIGMKNAMTRIRMYYGESADIRIDSRLHQGTVIYISIPLPEVT